MVDSVCICVSPCVCGKHPAATEALNKLQHLNFLLHKLALNKLTQKSLAEGSYCDKYLHDIKHSKQYTLRVKYACT